MIESEHAASVYNIGTAFNSIIVNKAHREGYEVLADVVAAQQELGQRYFTKKEQAEDIRMDKIHALLEVVKDKEEIERQISQLTYQIELHTINRKGLEKRLEQIERIEKAHMIQAASCSAAITHVIKPFETLVEKQHKDYKGMIQTIQNSEKSEE